MLRTIGSLSTPMLFGAVAVTAKDDKDGKAAATKVRPSDLPLYAPAEESKCHSCHSNENKKSTGIRGNVEEGVGVVRSGITDSYHAITSQTDQIDHFIQTGKAHAQSTIDYLNEPTNTVPRAGAIALGGLSGFIIGLRHGSIRRLLYTSIGAGAIASLCYPKEAEEYAQKALVEAKTYAKVGYNFAYGVKPGDEPNFPKIPSTMSELLESVNQLFASTKDKLSSDKPKN